MRRVGTNSFSLKEIKSDNKIIINMTERTAKLMVLVLSYFQRHKSSLSLAWEKKHRLRVKDEFTIIDTRDMGKNDSETIYD